MTREYNVLAHLSTGHLEWTIDPGNTLRFRQELILWVYAELATVALPLADWDNYTIETAFQAWLLILTRVTTALVDVHFTIPTSSWKANVQRTCDCTLISKLRDNLIICTLPARVTVHAGTCICTHDNAIFIVV